MVFSDWLCWMEGISKMLNMKPCERTDHLAEWRPSTGEWRRGDIDQRTYWTYEPPTGKAGSSRSLVVMLHGCCQSPADFSYTSNMIPVADEENLVLLFPDQSESSNARKCWNWFRDDQRGRDHGEPERIARMTRRAISRYRIAVDRVFLAGFSAGGAMVPVMISTHPELFSSAAIHSGLAYGAAKGVADAFRAMSCGSPDPEQKAREMFDQMKSSPGGISDPVPVMIVHGTEDRTVSVGNVPQIASQMAHVNLQILRDRGEEPRLQQNETRHQHRGRAFREMTITDRERTTLVKVILVEGLGHDWSGGPEDAPYSDPEGPDAARLIWNFFATASLPRADERKVA